MTLREPKAKKSKERQRAKNLSMVARQAKITKLILEKPLTLTPKLVAKRFNVSLSTAKRDLRDPELYMELRKALQSFASGELTQTAVNNIAVAIQKGDPDMSKWLLEKAQFFPSEIVKIDGKITTQVELGEDLGVVLEAMMEDPKIRKEIMKRIAPSREDKGDEKPSGRKGRRSKTDRK